MKFKVDFTGAGSSGNKPTLTLGTAKLKIDNENNTATFMVDSSKLPPRPYSCEPDPITVGPEDPKDLQQVFQKVESTEGLINNVVKMFDALLIKGHEREAAEMQAQIDQGLMPEVVIYTGVMEEYADAGKTGRCSEDSTFLEDAKKYLLEMMDMGLRPNAEAYTAVFKAFARREKAAEAKRFLEEMKGRGFVADEKAVREVLKVRRGPVVKSVIKILFAK
ncbi:hypothetical protein M0R45_028712 [Rubus argutus]|uniref:Pentatricopeptide repeat-containing protein n=1 Tax=Rubus argutus TaxID=59490 RepID=A0AAW1W641_RUBAR